MREEPDQHAAPPSDEQAESEHPLAERQAEERPEGFRRQWQPRLYVGLVILGLIVAYGIAFVLENNKHVNVHFVVATARVSLIWLILLSVALGLLLGVLLSQLYRRRRRRH